LSVGTLITMFGILRWVRERTNALITSKASRSGQLAGPAMPLTWRGPVLMFFAGWGEVLLVGVGLIGLAIFRANSH
jgi:hypothetical protein